MHLYVAALGCGDPHLPPGAWFKRRGDQATVGCNFTSQVWHIVCSTGRWIGTIDNCTAGEVTRDLRQGVLNHYRIFTKLFDVK